MPFADDAAMRTALREPFPKEQIGKLPATPKRPALDFVGHAAVTQRLNDAEPGWFYTIDELFSMGEVCWLRGTMTVGGISRPEYGDGDNPKDAIGNFIRRGAMRFGVALDLWSRQELKDIDRDHRPEPAGKQAPPASPASVEGVTAVEDPSRPVAPISSAEDRRAVTSVEGEEQESGHPLPPSSPERSEVPASDESEPGSSSSAMGTATPAPDSKRDSLWKQLVEFSGSEAKARNEINSRLKTGWTKGNTEHIPLDDIENTLRAVLQEAG